MVRSTDRGTAFLVPAEGLLGVDSHNSDCVIVEYCGYVFRGEFIGRVRDQEARLANGTITNYHTPKGDRFSPIFGRHDIVLCLNRWTYFMVATTMLPVRNWMTLATPLGVAA